MHDFHELQPAPYTAMPASSIVDLSKLGQAKIESRHRNSVGGSDAKIIAGGDAEQMAVLADIKRGTITNTAHSDDVSIQLDHWTEAFNLAWFEKISGLRVHGRGVVVPHPDRPWAHVSVAGACMGSDGFPTLLEPVGSTGFESIADVVKREYPRLQHNMWCLDWDQSFLTIIQGVTRHVIQPVFYDPIYMNALAAAEEKFWEAMQSGAVIWPLEMPPIDFDIEQAVETDMTGNTAWADAAARFLATIDLVDVLADAKLDLKAAMPSGSKTATGHGVIGKKAKNGRAAFTKMEPPVAPDSATPAEASK